MFPDGYTVDEVCMVWRHSDVTGTSGAVKGIEQAVVPQFTIVSYATTDRVVETATGRYQRLSLIFILRRSVGYFIFQTYLPCVSAFIIGYDDYTFPADYNNTR